MSSRQRVRSIRAQSQEPQLLYSRKQAARLLGFKSIDTIIELEHMGRLTPIRPTARPNSQVFYNRSEIEAIAQGGVQR